MGKSVRVPDPVYSKITSQAERQDIPRGVIVREWMDKAEKYDELEARR
jgi:hypothetical protein